MKRGGAGQRHAVVKWCLPQCFLVAACVALVPSAVMGQEAKRSTTPLQSIQAIQSLVRGREYDRALAEIRVQLKQRSDDGRLWTLQGIVLSLEGNKADALAAFEKALRLSPDDPAALRGAVQLYSPTDDARAIPLLERIVALNPGDQTAHEMLALLEEKADRCATAAAHFRLSAEAMASHPGSLEAYGSCLIQMGQYTKAADVFERLVALLPGRAYAVYDLAVALVAAGQEAKAIKLLEPLISAAPSDVQLLSLAADAYEKVGDTPKAVSLLREAIVQAPANAGFYASFAALCLDHESFQVGIDMLNAGLARLPREPSLYISRGLLYAQLAEYDRAEADFKTAETFDAGQSVSAYALDLAELQRNNPVNALAQVRTQLRAHPDSALLHYLLAKLLSTEGVDTVTQADDEAEREALIAVKLKPNLVEARDLLATMYSRSQRYGLAIEQCRLALRENADDQTAIYHLIIALRHAEQGSGREEIQTLVKRLAELQKVSRQKETDRKRFRFEEQPSPL